MHLYRGLLGAFGLGAGGQTSALFMTYTDFCKLKKVHHTKCTRVLEWLMAIWSQDILQLQRKSLLNDFPLFVIISLNGDWELFNAHYVVSDCWSNSKWCLNRELSPLGTSSIEYLIRTGVGRRCPWSSPVFVYIEWFPSYKEVVGVDTANTA